ncbi:MAG TPA: Crp/Fnr family transcriptional regulator [Tepidisphaeraceae bacterium]|nr:Crp/Fnr family transcriptional regulator [Tepidisphaeraceae bacterium]
MSFELNTMNRTEDSVAATFADPSVGGRQIEFASGATVFEQGADAGHLYFIQRGQVRLYQEGPDGSGRLLEILGAGQWFGCSALSETRQFHAKAVAFGRTVLMQTPVENVLEVVRRSPEAAVQLITQLADNVQAAREDSARLVFDDCNERLIKTLVRFSRTAAATPHDDGVVLHITHEQLAQAVGVARETVSLALTEMRLNHLVRTGRNQLTFNPAALQQFASRSNKINGNAKAAPREEQPAEVAA